MTDRPAAADVDRVDPSAPDGAPDERSDATLEADRSEVSQPDAAGWPPSADGGTGNVAAVDDVPADDGVGVGDDGTDDGGDDAVLETDGQPDWDRLVADDPRSRAELLAELNEAESRRDEYLEDVRRARAEFENFRKRMMREGSSQRAAGKADLIARLLEVLDDFDRTVAAAEASEDAGLRKGVELVHGKLVGVLRDAGLARIDEPGVAFDPTMHEAVQQITAGEPGGDPTVHQVLRPGYRVGDRVLRAAMVVVEQ